MANPRFYYDNRLNDATPVASSTAVGFAVANLMDWRPYTWWQPTAMPATVTTDCGSAKAADYALIYGHNLHTQGATIEIRGSTDNFVASDVLVATSTPATDDPVLLSFASTSFRYWRAKVTGALVPSLAIVSIGAALEAPVPMEEEFEPISREVQGQGNQNENGQPLGRAVYFEMWSQELTFTNVSWTWLRNTFLPAWRSNLRGSPFGFCWEAALFPGEVMLVTAGTKAIMPHRAGSLADLVIDLQGVIT